MDSAPAVQTPEPAPRQAETANLQPRLTVKQAAALMNVSPRGIYRARAIVRQSPELAAQVEAGTLTMSEAERAIRAGAGKPDNGLPVAKIPQGEGRELRLSWVARNGEPFFRLQSWKREGAGWVPASGAILVDTDGWPELKKGVDGAMAIFLDYAGREGAE